MGGEGGGQQCTEFYGSLGTHECMVFSCRNVLIFPQKLLLV